MPHFFCPPLSLDTTYDDRDDNHRPSNMSCMLTSSYSDSCGRSTTVLKRGRRFAKLSLRNMSPAPYGAPSLSTSFGSEASERNVPSRPGQSLWRWRAQLFQGSVWFTRARHDTGRARRRKKIPSKERPYDMYALRAGAGINTLCTQLPRRVEDQVTFILELGGHLTSDSIHAT